MFFHGFRIFETMIKMCTGVLDRQQEQLLEGRPESEEFPFHAEESAQLPCAEMCVEGRKEGQGNLV
jgi:hypothetical protein